MKSILARIPWLTQNDNGPLLAGVFIASDKVVAVLLSRNIETQAWEITKTHVEPFENEITKLAAIEKLALRLPKESRVCIIVSEQHYQWVQIDKPNLSEQEIISSLPWTVKELVNLETTDIVADYYESSLQQAGQAKVNVVVASRTVLMPILNVFHNQSMALEVISTPEMAFCDMLEHDGSAHMLVTQHLSAEPSLHIIRDGELLLSRRLRGLMSLAQQPLEQLKAGLLDAFGLELQRSLDYFESQLKQPPIKTLHLSLPNLELNGIVDELSRFFPVKVIPFVPNIALCQQQNADVQFAIAGALSLEVGNEITH